ncbi:universal stress protein [Thermodesulfobacteriota bacterium]
MYRYKRLMVGVSLNQQDGASIRYAAMVSRLAESEKITFLHIASTPEVEADVCELYPDLRQSCDDSTTQEIERLVKQHYDGHPDTRLKCEAVEGYPLVELLRRAKDEEIDLIIMRKRKGDKISGNLSTKLARKAPCSVLFVPEGTKSWYSNILVPIDFSENSKDALDVAIAFALAGDTKQIHCLNIYHVPTGYYKTGKSYEEFSEIMKGHAEERYQQFIKNINFKGVTPIPKFRLEDRPAKGIWEEVLEAREVNLLIIGAKGRKAGAGVLLGSVAEHLIQTTKVPLLAVKKKGTGLGFLEALLKL